MYHSFQFSAPTSSTPFRACTPPCASYRPSACRVALSRCDRGSEKVRALRPSLFILLRAWLAARKFYWCLRCGVLLKHSYCMSHDTSLRCHQAIYICRRSAFRVALSRCDRRSEKVSARCIFLLSSTTTTSIFCVCCINDIAQKCCFCLEFAILLQRSYAMTRLSTPIYSIYVYVPVWLCIPCA